jgi:NADH-quinone oxidoreductase subunit N
VLLTSVFKPLRRMSPGLTLIVLASETAGLLIWYTRKRSADAHLWPPCARRPGDLDFADRRSSPASYACFFSIRTAAEQSGRAEYHALLLGSVLGMVLLAQATEPGHLLRRDRDPLDPALHPLRRQPAPRGLARVGLKYLIVGSLGSATLLYGMAFLYGGSARPDFAWIAAGIAHKGCSATR